MAVIIDTAQLPAGERVEALEEALSRASARCHVVPEGSGAELRSQLEAWRLGQNAVATMRSSGLQLLRTRRQAVQEPVPVLTLALQQRGDGRVEQLGQKQLARPGELFLVDLSEPYDYAWSGAGAASSIAIPFDQLGLPVELIRAAAGSLPSSPLYPMVTTYLSQLVGDAARLTGDPAAASTGAASVELCRALFTSAGYGDKYTAKALAETLLTRVRGYVRQHLRDPDLHATKIAAAHHVSVRQLYKVCAEAEFSLEQWIISERLQHAREELARPDWRHQPVAWVAQRWGFRDPAYFSRRFRSAYGVSPREFRQLTAPPISG